MAWQFIGFMEPGTVKVGNRRVDMHGPLPVKRWNRLLSLGKRHKMNYRTPRRVSKLAAGGKSDYERRAIEYCRWLAARDGVAIGNVGRPQWYGKHIQMVAFFDKQNGRVTIEIPNWDFEPVEPIETIDRPGDGLVEWLNVALAA